MSCLSLSILLAATITIAGQDGGSPFTEPGSLETQLRREDLAALARDARRLGDSRRGALVFYQPALMCTKCHLGEGATAPKSLGPDLTALGKPRADAEIVEAILEPSKAISIGYETVTIVTDDGRTTSGLLADDRPDVVILRDPGQAGKLITIAKGRIDQRDNRGPSLMPAGLVSALASRQQFLDLVRYVLEIAEHGPEMARTLRPDPARLTPPLADYELNLDHARLIGGLGPKSFERGEAIYNRVCANCHGTKERAGSLPNAPRFTSAILKNGADPYRMYRTLTDGFGQMAAQTWLVPRQKYDLIHYIREAYFKTDNKVQYAVVEKVYLDRLPRGTSLGPAPTAIEPWSAMDYGPSLSATIEAGDDGSNFAYKGIAVRLDAGQGGISRGRAWVVYDHDTLRLAAAWTGQGFIDWKGINFDGRHQAHPRITGRIHLSNPDGPGWANPQDQSFADLRERGRDGQSYGPLPRQWAHFHGLYRHGAQVVLSYTIGTAEILETPGLEIDPAHPGQPIFTRTLEIGPSPAEVTMRVARAGAAACSTGNVQASLFAHDGFTLLRVPRSPTSRVYKVLMSSGAAHELETYTKSSPPAVSLAALIRGGPAQWPEIVKTQTIAGRDDGPLTSDVLTVPDNNPWHCQMRPSGFDFFADGHRAAVCTWDGDVWLVGGLDQPSGELTWQRIASGLFQPLGLKIVAGRIYVGCRDQIVRLNDLNGDGETDFYESFNSDHQVTEHFHEFAMGLQTDRSDNFYYAKAARHGLTALVPQHGTLLRVSKDGARTQILATGFRAPNGVCLNPDGTFFLSDQEGFWTPKNRINWVKPGGFYGNMWGYHQITDSSDKAMEPPVCWITNAMDRSPAELVWVQSDHPNWRPLRGTLLSLSYGNGKIFVVPHEIVNGQMQGGVCALPLQAFPTGIMRGRFNPADGQLYACGLFGWAGDRTQPGGFYRVRTTGKPLFVPIGLVARPNLLAITFSGTLDPIDARLSSHYQAKIWSLRRTASYGSDHHDEHPVRIAGATLSEDAHTVILEIPELRPSQGMEVAFAIKAATGERIQGVIHNTIHHLRD
jgi:putative heme-binding domain-containing protein